MANNWNNGRLVPIALFKFESGALYTDSQGGNSLQDHNSVSTETASPLEGTGSARFYAPDGEYLSITDANTDADFPLRENDANRQASFCFRIKLNSDGDTFPHILGRYSTSAGRVFAVAYVKSTLIPYISIGYANGGSADIYYFGSAMSVGTEYSGVFVYDGDTETYRLSIYDKDGATYLDTDLTGTASNAMDVSTFGTPDFTIGGRSGDGGQYLGALVDELAAIKGILTTEEIGQVHAGTYGASGSFNPALTINSNIIIQPGVF